MGYTARPVELTCFAAKGFPPQPDELEKLDKLTVGSVVYSFIDSSLSIQRMCGPEFAKPPWRPLMPTLTTKAVIVLRAIFKGLDGKTEVEIRPTHGLELMQVIGWDVAFYRGDEIDRLESSFLTRLAGNAYSGFMFLAIVFGMGSAIGSSVRPPSAALPPPLVPPGGVPQPFPTSSDESESDSD